MVADIFFSFLSLCGSNPFILIVQGGSFVFKSVLLIFVCKTVLQTKKLATPVLFLLIIILCSIFENIAWIITLLHDMTSLPSSNTQIACVLLGWAASAILYQCLLLFIYSFRGDSHKIKLPLLSKIFIGISFFASCAMIVLAFLKMLDIPVHPTIVRLLFNFQAIYSVLILMPYAIFQGIVILQKEALPRIVRHQLQASLTSFLIPHFIANFWQNYPFTHFLHAAAVSHPEAVSLSEIFLTLAIFYFVKTIIGLRFLNLHSHVHDGSKQFDFIHDFKTILENLGNAETIAEVKVLTQQFYKKAFNIDSQKIIFITRTLYAGTEKTQIITSPIHTLVENFISHETIFEKSEDSNRQEPPKILIYDEIAYTHFHEPTDATKRLLVFLEKINADIFIPLYDQDRIIAYIILTRNAREQKLYTNIERDEMIIFSTYAAKVVNLLQNKNLNELFKERKEINEELYKKHQEITRYKESVLSFLKMNKGNSIGIIFYKHKHFSFANEDAIKIIGIDPNKEIADPIAKTLNMMAQKIESYKTSQMQIVKNIHNKRFVISGIPYADQSGVIFTVYYPEVSDVIQELIDNIKDPSNWDYLLYLETTESGQLINELVPSNTEILLNFKIELLKIALTKKAVLLNLPEDDIVPMVELIHHISLKETLHIIELTGPEFGHEAAISLFGINPLFNPHTNKEALLEKLDKKGTILIKNVHFLDIESQKNLAEFIRYGFYKVLKTDRKMFSDVRIICSTSQNLEYLTQEGLFSQALLNVLRITSLHFPSLLTLPDNEIEHLIEGFSEQALQEKSGTSRLLTFSEQDRERLLSQKPVSLFELKKRVQDLLITKSKKSDVYETVTFNPSYNVTDPKLAQAARLGKYALKDPQVMSLLWNKFKNQNKIALFLGVNRSSVYRRCKDYGIF